MMAFDWPALLALNNAHAVETSELTLDELVSLQRQAFRFEAIATDALLIALDERADDYDSPNYLWFRARYDRFVYVDRVIVAAAARGHGLARQLYLTLFDAALSAGHDRVVCEVNVDPPNLPSEAFHARLGFDAIGEAWLPARGKRVRYLERTLAAVRGPPGGLMVSRVSASR